MREHLVQVLKERRETGGPGGTRITQRALEIPTDRDASNISRIERGETRYELDRVDRLVAAYAEAAGVSPIELWEEALDRWRKAERVALLERLEFARLDRLRGDA